MTFSAFKPNDINGTVLWDWIKDKAEDAGNWTAEKLGDGAGKRIRKDAYRAVLLEVGKWTIRKLGEKQ